MTVNKTKQRIWEFGPYRLEEAERQLLRDGSPVGLTPKVFDTLVALIERSGRLVEKDELMARLWPDTFVEEGALTRNISDLRKALGVERYVETVPKRGYRFVAPVREISDESGALIAEKTVEAQLFIREEEEEAWPSVLSLQRHAGSERSLKSRLARTLAVAILIAGGALGLGRLLKSNTTLDETRHAFQAMELSRFTASGNVLTAAISPDGKYVATALDENGLQSLWLRQARAPTSGFRLLAPAPVEYWGLTFSNDSTFIYYVSWVRNQSDAELYQLPVLGGAPRRIHVGNIDTPISFAPAGDRFAYVTSSSSRGEAYVKVANADEGAQTIVTRPNPGSIMAYPGGPAWSRDGRFIAYAASGSGADERQQMRVFVANVEDKDERQLTGRGWVEIGRVAWLGDGSGLVISAREQKDAPRQLWFVSWPDGASRRITNDLHDYDSVSLSDDAGTLAAVQTQAAFSIAVAPQGDDYRAGAVHSQPSEIFSEVSGGRPSIAWTPDNRLVYCSRASGVWDIWLMNKDGSDQRRLTIDPQNELFPAVSADGRHIFFASDKDGAFNIWRMEIDGRLPTRLTRGANQILPEVTPDGQWVVYQQDGSGMDNTSLWRVAAAGGEPERLADSSLMRQRPAISPDGGSLAYVYMDEQGWGLAVRPLGGGETNRKFPFPSTISSRFFRWTPDGQALAYIVKEKGASNIRLQPLSGAPPGKLTNFTAGQLSSFAWSTDGQWLAYMRHTAMRDVVLLKDFK